MVPVIALMALIAIGVSAKKKKSGGGYQVTQLPGAGTPSSAWTMAVGLRGEPQIAALLAEMESMIVSAGIPKVGWSAYELTAMNKASGDSDNKPVAIPIRGLWANILPALEMFVGIRTILGFPLIIRNGYRDAEYNAAVSGTPRSQHLWFTALDISSDDAAERGALAEVAAQLYVDSPGEPIGFGVYGNESTAGRTHLDYGWKRRTWDNAKFWISVV